MSITFRIDQDCELAITNIVESACLLHDIGNPPFGHFGEAAISNWYSAYLETKKTSSKAATQQKDFLNFDGNPQGFRVIAKLAGIDGTTGMNLTVAQMATTVKYPFFPEGINKKNPLSKKAGVFLSERNVWEQVCEKTQLLAGRRFPLAYLMEAADDISYCFSDIEDGIEKGIIGSHEAAVQNIMARISSGNLKKIVKKAFTSSKANAAHLDPVVSFRSSLVRYLVQQASRVYISKHSEVLEGKLKGLVEPNSAGGELLQAIRGAVGELLYGRRESHRVELVGHAAIKGILKAYESVLALKRDDLASFFRKEKCENRLSEEMRLFSLIAKKHITTYEVATKNCADMEELFARTHLIIDFVAGMTDAFALRTYQNLSGISL